MRRWWREIWMNLMGCPHKRTSFPISPVIRGVRRKPYVVCTQCGAEFEYSWETMTLGKEIATNGAS